MNDKFTKYLRPILISFFIFLISCKEQTVEVNDADDKKSIVSDTIASLTARDSFDFLPTSTSNAIYQHKGYAFSYVEKYEQSEWVAYELEDGNWKYAEYERPLFIQDPIVTTESAHWGNYKKSGYTKGHLCPAADRKQNQALFLETFFTSNVSPQTYEFNAGVWNRLEQKVRYWAGKYHGLYVITGGVLTNNLESIGREDVAVPKYFYKVLLTKDHSKMIAFLVPHESSKLPLYEFVTNVDEIEKLTGINFFPKLDDSLESKMEMNKSYKEWSFN